MLSDYTGDEDCDSGAFTQNLISSHETAPDQIIGSISHFGLLISAHRFGAIILKTIGANSTINLTTLLKPSHQVQVSQPTASPVMFHVIVLTLIFFALYNSFHSLIDFSQNQGFANQITASDLARYARVKHWLTNAERVLYVCDFDLRGMSGMPTRQDYPRYLSVLPAATRWITQICTAQRALAPFYLTRDTITPQWMLIDSQERHPRLPTSWTVVKNFGDGMILLERQ
jgi:hypothetical protein